MTENEIRGEADFQTVYTAWLQCRKKSATPQARRYEIRLLDNLIDTVQALQAGCWRPHYRLVRRRVIGNLRRKLENFEQHLLVPNARGRQQLRLLAELRQRLRSVLASYLGRFRHAHYHRLLGTLWRRYRWLDLLFIRRGHRLLLRWEPAAVSGYRSQVAWFRRQFSAVRLQMQQGTQIDRIDPDPSARWREDACRQATWVMVCEEGFLKGGLKRRLLYTVEFRGGRGCVPQAPFINS